MPTKKDRIKKHCEKCGKVFYRLESQLKIKGSGRFCSKHCMEESRKNGSVLKCEFCDKEFYRRFSEQDLHIIKKQYCSKKCYFSDRAKNMKSYKKVNGVHEHRTIVSEYLGKKLTSKEIIHHIDGNKLNNSIENLCLMSQNIHAKVHFVKNFNIEPYRITNILKGKNNETKSK